jgi:hypothetical protein
MLDVLSTLIGFLIGIVAAGFAVELGLKKWLAPPQASKLTTVWSLDELKSPEVVATQLGPGLQVPKTARVVTGSSAPPAKKDFQLRRNGDAHGSFALDSQKPRALLFLGEVKPGALALWTVDEVIIQRLRAEFNRLWTRSTDYVERTAVADIAQKPNVTIETSGTVQDIIPYKGRFMMRLIDHGDAVGVVVDQDLAVRGQKVTVKGIVRNSSSGYPLVEALEVKAEA